MANYKSIYTGEEIDAGIAKANTAIQEHQDISSKQDKLVSGTNIKTINNLSLLGSGNINISGGEGSVDYYEKAKTLLTRLNNKKYNNPQATQAADEYDIILFSGQSNSCGRARTSDVQTSLDVFLNISQDKAISFNNNSSGSPQKITEPITANGTNYYGYIPAWLNAYYAVTGRKVCTCYSSNGGTPIANFMKGSTYYGASKVNNTKTALTSNNKTIGHIYLVWCQGETDGDQSNTTDYYKTSFRQMLDDLKADCGIEKAFIMRIGQINSGTSEKYRPIIKAQNELAQEYDDIIMASTIFAGALNFKEEDGSTRNLMRDQFHYKPEGYLRAGLEGGSNAGCYVNSGEKPTLLEYERLRIDATGWADTKKYEREIDKYLFMQYLPYGLQRLLDDGGSTPPTPPTPTGVVVNPTTLTGAVGGTGTITATIQPSEATGTIVWTTSDSSVATVNNGTVSYVGPGNATITATVQGTAYSASCSVVVSGAPVTPTEIVIDQDSVSVPANRTTQLTYTIQPTGATGTINWASSDDTVATVSNGLVTGVTEGTATITATIDGTQISDTCDVTVTAPITPTGIELSDSAMVLNQRESQQLTYTLLPAEATGTVTWSTNDASVATVNNGLVTGVGTGMTTITATVDGTALADTCEVSVQANPYLLNLDFTNGKLPSDYVSDGTLSKSDIVGTSETDGLRITTTATSVGNGIVFANPIQMPTNFAIEAKFQTYNNGGTRFGIANAITLISNGSSRPMVNLYDGYLQFRLVSTGGDQKITSLGQIYDWSTDGLVTLRVECRNKDLTVYKNGNLVGTATLSSRTADTFSGCTNISAFPYWYVGDLISYIRIEELAS